MSDHYVIVTDGGLEVRTQSDVPWLRFAADAPIPLPSPGLYLDANEIEAVCSGVDDLPYKVVRTGLVIRLMRLGPMNHANGKTHGPDCVAINEAGDWAYIEASNDPAKGGITACVNGRVVQAPVDEDGFLAHNGIARLLPDLTIEWIDAARVEPFGPAQGVRVRTAGDWKVCMEAIGDRVLARLPDGTVKVVKNVKTQIGPRINRYGVVTICTEGGLVIRPESFTEWTPPALPQPDQIRLPTFAPFAVTHFDLDVAPLIPGQFYTVGSSDDLDALIRVCLRTGATLTVYMDGREWEPRAEVAAVYAEGKGVTVRRLLQCYPYKPSGVLEPVDLTLKLFRSTLADRWITPLFALYCQPDGQGGQNWPTQHVLDLIEGGWALARDLGCREVCTYQGAENRRRFAPKEFAAVYASLRAAVRTPSAPPQPVPVPPVPPAPVPVPVPTIDEDAMPTPFRIRHGSLYLTLDSATRLYYLEAKLPKEDHDHKFQEFCAVPADPSKKFDVGTFNAIEAFNWRGNFLDIVNGKPFASERRAYFFTPGRAANGADWRLDGEAGKSLRPANGAANAGWLFEVTDAAAADKVLEALDGTRIVAPFK